MLGALSLRRACSAKDARNTQVLIDLRPVNPFAFADELPIISLIGCRMKQARIPNQRSRNPASIDEMHGELIVGHDDLHGTRFRLSQSARAPGSPLSLL